MEEQLKNLLSEGFKPFRKIWNEKNKTFEFKEQKEQVFTQSFSPNFNVMQPGGIAIWLIKGEEVYYFGLHNMGEPPILIKEN